jgi:hypothetical protein
MSEKKRVDIFTDGACSGNPGPGGWGAILRYGSRERELFGAEANTTNNRMELTAAIMALEALKTPCDVVLYSDSRYLVDAVEKGWLFAWQARGWLRADKNRCSTATSGNSCFFRWPCTACALCGCAATTSTRKTSAATGWRPRRANAPPRANKREGRAGFQRGEKMSVLQFNFENFSTRLISILIWYRIKTVGRPA